jgi:hypothetical protein
MFGIGRTPRCLYRNNRSERTTIEPTMPLRASSYGSLEQIEHPLTPITRIRPKPTTSEFFFFRSPWVMLLLSMLALELRNRIPRAHGRMSSLEEIRKLAKIE